MGMKVSIETPGFDLGINKSVRPGCVNIAIEEILLS